MLGDTVPRDRMVRELAGRAGLPMPRVFIMDNPQPNAFATGRNPQNAAVAVTTGLMQSLSREELAGVVAHELAHIKHHDTLLMTITATIAGAISMLAQFGMFFGGGHRDSNGQGGGLGIIGSLAMMILAPLGAMLVQMAISRTREYAADETGAPPKGLLVAAAVALAEAVDALVGRAVQPDVLHELLELAEGVARRRHQQPLVLLEGLLAGALEHPHDVGAAAGGGSGRALVGHRAPLGAGPPGDRAASRRARRRPPRGIKAESRAKKKGRPKAPPFSRQATRAARITALRAPPR